MADDGKPPVGTMIGFDLTVPDAADVRDFYAAVIGWRPEDFNMGPYVDYVMRSPENDDFVAGICHARDANHNLPAQWLAYIVVDDLDVSLEQVTRRGGSLLTEVKEAPGQPRYCVISDPAGANLALMQQD